ncbi:MAG: hypothetical protein JW941_05790 [Candidatus Coatesbacteria bacterium]|nr:hypothetical protein [Candidatus Coatesbacteria bacterium]
MTRRRTNQSIFLGAAMLFILATLAGAQGTPDVSAAGANPSLVTYGDDVTFWAEIAKTESVTVSTVWIVYEFFPLLQLTEVDSTDTLTVWEGYWTVPNFPGLVPPADYLLSAIAVSEAGVYSEPEPFILSITDHDPTIPDLWSPADGTCIFRNMSIIFEWSSVPNAEGYNFEITFPDEEAVSFYLPFFITSMTVNPDLAASLMDGVFSWRVQAVFGDGPGAWSEPFTFEKQSEHGLPTEFEGVVTSIELENNTLFVEAGVWVQKGDNPWAWWFYEVKVTDETTIVKEGEGITLAEIVEGDHVFVQGWLEEDIFAGVIAPVVTAQHIEVVENTMPEYITGRIDEILPDERAFWLADLGLNPGRPMDRAFVRLTEDVVLTRLGQLIEFEQIQPGDIAVAYGSWQTEGDFDYFLADTVDLSVDSIDRVLVEGSISQIDYENSLIYVSGTSYWAPSIVMQGKVIVSVTPETMITRNEEPAAIEDLMVGDWTIISGERAASDVTPPPSKGNPADMVIATTINAYESAPHKL